MSLLVVKRHGPDSPPAATYTPPFAVTSATTGFRAIYDPNGNMLLRVEVSGARRITYLQEYDAENRLAAVTHTVTGEVVRFVYDGDGHRVLRIGPEGTTVTLGDHYEQTGGTVRKYYYAGGGRVAMREGGILYFLHGDHLGSATLTTDVSGNRVGELRYTPYGVTRYEWGNIPTDRRYTGQRWEGFGLYDYGARMYSPALGRWASADTIVPDPWNPQSLNRYAYVYNRPLVYIDTDGRFPWIPLIALGVAIWLIPGDTGPYEVSPANEALGEAALSVAWEPYDWASTSARCSHRECNVLDYLGFAPVIPGAIGRLDDVGKAIRAAEEVEDATDALRRIPYGFRNAEEFAQFGARLHEGLKRAGYEDVQVFFRGSSVTGVSFRTGVPFDVGRVSDFDLALVSPGLFQQAKELGIELRGGGTRTMPLGPKHLEALGLSDLAKEMRSLTGRKVNFMIYKSVEDVLKRGPAIAVPR